MAQPPEAQNRLTCSHVNEINRHVKDMNRVLRPFCGAPPKVRLDTSQTSVCSHVEIYVQDIDDLIQLLQTIKKDVAEHVDITLREQPGRQDREDSSYSSATSAVLSGVITETPRYSHAERTSLPVQETCGPGATDLQNHQQTWPKDVDSGASMRTNKNTTNVTAYRAGIYNPPGGTSQQTD